MKFQARNGIKKKIFTGLAIFGVFLVLVNSGYNCLAN